MLIVSKLRDIFARIAISWTIGNGIILSISLFRIIAAIRNLTIECNHFYKKLICRYTLNKNQNQCGKVGEGIDFFTFFHEVSGKAHTM